MNGLMTAYGDMALAGIGVAMKVTMMTGMICIGFGQGVQPLLGYCVGARLWERFQKVMRFSLLFSLGLSVVMTGLCYLFTKQIVQAFLNERQRHIAISGHQAVHHNLGYAHQKRTQGSGNTDGQDIPEHLFLTGKILEPLPPFPTAIPTSSVPKVNRAKP